MDFLEFSNVAPGKAYSLRKSGEVSVSAKSVEFCGGVDGITRRLVALWYSMEEHYHIIGENWYGIAHDFAVDLGEAYEFTTWQVSQVISAVSPQNPWNGKLKKDGTKGKWDGNRLCAIKVVQAFYYGGESEVYKLRGWGYAPMFLAKAIQALRNETVDWSTSLKTGDFALLIDSPKLEDVAVIDTHASRIALANLGNRYHVVGNAAYKLIAEAYRRAAKIIGVRASVLQAGLWQYAVDGRLY